MVVRPVFFFLLTDTPPPDIYTLSLHDALPIWSWEGVPLSIAMLALAEGILTVGNLVYAFEAVQNRYVDEIADGEDPLGEDRKSTRLNSSHVKISYAVFCLKKKTRRLKLPR